MSEIEQYLQDMQGQLDEERNRSRELQKAVATNIFDSDNNDNLVKWQLDIKEELARIENLLRKSIPRVDENGNEYFEKAKDVDQIFNDNGVNQILNLLAWYLNKNIILSNFDEKQIEMRMKQLGDELTDFVFNNYQEFGLNNKDKIKHYPIVIINIVNTIEAAYYRALNGGERESLRTARTVTQSEPIGGSSPYSQMAIQNQQRRFSMFKPTTWF